MRLQRADGEDEGIDAATERPRKVHAEARQQRHESYRIEHLLADADRRRFDDGESLHAALAFVAARERQHHAPARLQILAAARVGTCVAPAVTMIASTASVFAEIGAAVAVREAHVADLRATAGGAAPC